MAVVASGGGVCGGRVALVRVVLAVFLGSGERGMSGLVLGVGGERGLGGQP